MGVVFDTSVWIEYFKANPLYFSACQSYLDEANVFTLEVVFAELLQGAKGKKEIQIINGYFDHLPKLDRKGLIWEAGLFSQNEELIRKGIGLIDSIIIYATLNNQLKLWTLDKKITNYLDSDYLLDG